MASPELRMRSSLPVPGERRGSSGASRGWASLRLMEAERSEEVYPILLEEILELGYERAFIAVVDFETGELSPAASINYSRPYLDRFKSSVYAPENPIVNVIHEQKPAVVADSSLHHRSLYCHPIQFRNVNPCWEADRERRAGCLAYENSAKKRRLRLEEQVCSVCTMRAYAAVVAVEIPPKGEKDRVQLANLIELSNRYLSRLFKVEHYYNRMTDMELTIAQMETMMQSMTDPVILTDTHYRVMVQNKAAEKYFKYPETNGDSVTEGLARAIELNNLLFTAALSSMAVSPTETSRDLTLVDAYEGEETLFEAVCTPTFARDGMPIGVVTVMRDVTDLRRADQELRTNYDKLTAAEEIVRQDRDRLNLVIENVGDPIIVCDSEAKVVLLDPLAQQLFGVKEFGAKDGVKEFGIGELRAKGFGSKGFGLGDKEKKKDRAKDSNGQRMGFVREASLVKNQAQFDAYIAAFTYSFAHTNSAPLKLYNPISRSELEYDARSGKVYDERGQTAFTVTVLRDLSAVRKVEQLRVERRMLEIEKFASAGRLAATIAHEVNNPMEAIKNAIYLLSENVKPEAQPVYDILKSETERVARIVRQMLGLYRNNEQVKPVNVNTIIEDTIVLLNRQLQRTNIDVNVDLGELPDAVVAADQLRQVLSNLVINARDAMSSGGRLHVRTRHIPAADGIHGTIRIILADTGTGIPREMLGTIFEPFVTTKGEKGTGLGLWIVKGIMENHGGKITVRSKLGKGTIFNLNLPVVR